jgi:hypothetical protein
MKAGLWAAPPMAASCKAVNDREFEEITHPFEKRFDSRDDSSHFFYDGCQDGPLSPTSIKTPWADVSSLMRKA